MKKILKLPLILFILLLLSIISYFFYKHASIKPTNVCTQDALMCPDGTYVGRLGPKCEFEKCPAATPTPTPTPTSSPMVKETSDSTTKENKVCDWVDKSDIIIKLNFADGVTKDTSYEAGFYYSPIAATMRLARATCDYRTGFSFSEMKSKGVVQLGVRGYTDSKRRQLKNEPINVVFNEEGKPDIGNYMEIVVLN